MVLQVPMWVRTRPVSQEEQEKGPPFWQLLQEEWHPREGTEARVKTMNLDILLGDAYANLP